MQTHRQWMCPLFSRFSFSGRCLVLSARRTRGRSFPATAACWTASTPSFSSALHAISSSSSCFDARSSRSEVSSSCTGRRLDASNPREAMGSCVRTQESLGATIARRACTCSEKVTPAPRPSTTTSDTSQLTLDAWKMQLPSVPTRPDSHDCTEHGKLAPCTRRAAGPGPRAQTRRPRIDRNSLLGIRSYSYRLTGPRPPRTHAPRTPRTRSRTRITVSDVRGHCDRFRLDFFYK